MPVRKKQRAERVGAEEPLIGEAVKQGNVMCQMVDENGTSTGSQVLIPVSATAAQLDELLSSLMKADDADVTPYAFFIDGVLIKNDVATVLHDMQKDAFAEKKLSEGRRLKPADLDSLPFEIPEEIVVKIMYKPQANFRVRPVTRCSAALDGHSEAVLVCSFSPDGRVLATGGGDKEIRIWDVNTLTPIEELKGHHHWVQVLSWAPDGSVLVSGSKDGALLQWAHDEYSSFKSKSLKAHTNYVTHVAWEPLHISSKCERFVSASKDDSLKVWHVTLGLQFFLNGHVSCVTCVKWGGEGKIYSSSQDRTIMVWSAENGIAINQLKGHAHWVNFVALNTDLVIRTGYYDHKEQKFDDKAAAQEYAKERYDAVLARCGGERLVSCSDDNTMFLWNPSKTCTAISRMTGHQGAVLHIAFSPDGTMIASCGSDKSVKIWNALDGKFLHTFRGHVAAVYHVSWSLDSRMLVSGSRDTTLKLWSVANSSLVEDLSGHEDEIFCTDWSPDGQRVATVSKDKKVRIWVH
eukprot:Tbor_TRINITY_DN3474_c0_g1::TRINITY_DN3474_c0_g1_i1::g.3761::m.3761/K14855/RSA4, NLE1; ribosome assembly protein 4